MFISGKTRKKGTRRARKTREERKRRARET
jgi:hypothetical protein